jgi:hypothetical protein
MRNLFCTKCDVGCPMTPAGYAVCAAVYARFMAFVSVVIFLTTCALTAWFFNDSSLRWAALPLAGEAVRAVLFFIVFLYTSYLLNRVTVLERQVATVYRLTHIPDEEDRDNALRGILSGDESSAVQFKSRGGVVVVFDADL